MRVSPREQQQRDQPASFIGTRRETGFTGEKPTNTLAEEGSFNQIGVYAQLKFSARVGGRYLSLGLGLGLEVVALP